MLGEVYSSKFRDRILHLASMGFSGKHISTLLAVSKDRTEEVQLGRLQLGPSRPLFFYLIQNGIRNEEI
jgi:hypothetical protein